MHRSDVEYFVYCFIGAQRSHTLPDHTQVRLYCKSHISRMVPLISLKFVHSRDNM